MFRLVLIMLTFTAIPLAAAEKSLTLYFTSNVLGEIEPCGCVKSQLGGLHRRATLLKSINFKSEPNFLFDSGDLFFKSAILDRSLREQLLLKADILSDFYRQFRPDGMTPGEVDLSQGMSYLTTGLRQGLPYVNVNLVRANGETAFPAVQIIQRGGVRIAVTGVLSPKGYSAMAPNLLGIRYRPSAEILPKVVTDARKKSDLVVILLHAAEEEEKAILAGVPGPAIVLSSRNKQALVEPRILDERFWVFEADNRGQYVGKIKLTIKDRSKGFSNAGQREEAAESLAFLKAERENHPPDSAPRQSLDAQIKTLEAAMSSAPPKQPNRYWSSHIPLGDEVQADPEMKQVLEKYVQKVREIELKKDAELGLKEPTEADLKSVRSDFRFQGWRTCAGCHARETANWQKTRHARAFATLVAIQQEQNRECIGCHVVGWQEEGGFTQKSDLKRYQDVQCESCHGPAYEHVQNPKVKKFVAVTGELCGQCHSKDLGKTFNFSESLPQASCQVDRP